MNERVLALEAIELSLNEMGPNEEHRALRVGTALVWIVALNDAWRPKPGERDDRPSDVVELLHGATFARNATVHGLVVVATRGGLTVPFTVPLTIPVARWRPLEDILNEWQQPKKSRFWSQQTSGYEKHFAGRDAREPIREALDWLTRQAASFTR